MSEFEAWATATFRQSGIDVDPAELGLVELIYQAVFQQLQVLDSIDLEKFPAGSVDLRHSPKSA